MVTQVAIKKIPKIFQTFACGVFLGATISQTYNDRSHFAAVRAHTVLLSSWQIMNMCVFVCVCVCGWGGS